MRLSPAEVAAIGESAVQAFGEDAVVRVFGSRLDDSRRGGDIDLHIYLPQNDAAIGPEIWETVGGPLARLASSLRNDEEALLKPENVKTRLDLLATDAFLQRSHHD